MEIQYVSVKTRSQFGKQCIFDDEGPTIDVNILPNRDLMRDYVYRNPCHVGAQNSRQFAIHEAQTTSAPTKVSGMSHTEGGWPKDFNPRDAEATARYRRRVEKDDIWPIKMKKLMEPMERCILQNNAVNIYENYFDDMVTTELVLPLDVRTVNVYEDPQTLVRPITHLSWSPDHGKRLAVSYCSMEFEREPIDRNPWSYIWEIENPNKPFMALKAFCPSVTIEFNSRDPSMLISGLMSGQVCNWDIRQGDEPVQISHLQFSHRNPTNLALWINSKTNTEFFSASTGGSIKWWDIRKLREPTETLVMDLENPSRGDIVRAIGVSSLQFESIMGTKFMAGMENGIVISGTRKGKNAQEKLAQRFSCHDGPVIAIDRNPFSTKHFLTVGGWVARIWAEDTREGNLISTKRDKIALTGGCWSTSRYSVFYLIDDAGVLKIYDLLVGMRAPVKTIRLCNGGLKAISPHEEGNLVAVGSDMGQVYLVESSEGLTTNMRNDKNLMSTYLDRCSRYVKAVDNRLKEARLAQRISFEQVEEPVLPSKGKSKVVGKDDKRTDEKVTKGGSIDDKDKKGKVIRMKKIRNTMMLSGDPELADAEARYYEVINKETEKYAEAAALEESADEAVNSRISSPPLESRRKKHVDSKFDKDTMSGATTKRLVGPQKREERDKIKGRISRDGRISRAETRTEEIVIVRKTKSDRVNEQHEEIHEPVKINERKNELAAITEMHEEDETRMIDETKKLKVPSKGDKIEAGTRGRSNKKRETRGKSVEIKKPCIDYVCQPDICCVDEMAKKSRPKNSKTRTPLDTSGDDDSDNETKIMINEMLENLPKVASPDELGHLLDPIDKNARTSEKLIFPQKDAPPSILDEDVKIAKRKVREWKNSLIQGKSPRPMKLQSHKITIEDSSFREIFEDTEIAKIHRQDSQFIERINSRFEGISNVVDDDNDDDDEDEFTRKRENYTIKGKKVQETRRIKMPIDCEPVTVKFGEKEIKDIIGIPDAPRPSSRSRFDESTKKITRKKKDYPRISAAAIPKLEMKDDFTSK